MDLDGNGRGHLKNSFNETLYIEGIILTKNGL
jgi:hypothetical protein